MMLNRVRSLSLLTTMLLLALLMAPVSALAEEPALAPAPDKVISGPTSPVQDIVSRRTAGYKAPPDWAAASAPQARVQSPDTTFDSENVEASPAPASRPSSRLSRLLVRKTELYMPSRLMLGRENQFVVRAQPGSLVKVFISADGEGLVLSNGIALRVGTQSQELSGTVPESGVITLTLEMPEEEGFVGKTVYVDAVAGADEAQLAPVSLMDPSGRRTEANTLLITKWTEKGTPLVMPGLPGMNTQMVTQFTTVGEIYSTNDERRKQLLDDGTINRDVEADRNPFVNRGIQPGITPGR